MADLPAQVLLMGKNMRTALALQGHLQERGCECDFADSQKDALALLGSGRFHLVLGELEESKGALPQQIALAIDSGATLYYCLNVEDSCWWVPAVSVGRACWGTPALRPRDFSRVLDETLQEIDRRKPATEKHACAVAACGPG